MVAVEMPFRHTVYLDMIKHNSAKKTLTKNPGCATLGTLP